MLQLEAKETETVEMDEMHGCINQKNYCWIWIAVDRPGKRFIRFIVGDRSTETGKKLREKINGFERNATATDYRKSYDNIYSGRKACRNKSRDLHGRRL
ncbi:hypothetical protein Barb6_03014 [Bacteroidales bacterium Barb6]|nr:hypothetical protein Barb6_03014 [Bacteroidales bacterium Barb6]